MAIKKGAHNKKPGKLQVSVSGRSSSQIHKGEGDFAKFTQQKPRIAKSKKK